MNTSSKILLTTLPLVLIIFAAATGAGFYFSYAAISGIAESWMDSKLSEAVHITSEHEKLLHEYGLENIPPSIAKAKMDTGISLAHIDIGKQGFIFVLDQEGTIVLHPQPELIGENVKNTDWFAMISTEKGRLRYKNQGKLHLAKYDHFKPWNWAVIVTSPEEEVFHTIDRVKPFLLAIVIVGSLLLISAVMVLARKLTQPLHTLMRGAKKIGKGELSTRISVHSKDEYGQLAEVFNHMALQIEHSRSELEQRVKERTRELTKANSHLQNEIEERKQAVAALRAGDLKMKAILRASPIGIGLVVDRRLNWANEEMYNLFHHEKDSLLNKSARNLYSDDDEYERVGKLLYQHVKNTAKNQIEAQMATKDGKPLTCNLRAHPLDPNDHSKGLIVAITDITQSKKLEVRLQQAQKMEAIGTLAGGVAHDLNNILSGIVSYPELLLLELPENSPLRKPLLTIQKSGERATTVVQDLLTMARRGVSTMKIININKIIREQMQSPEFEQLMLFHPKINIELKLSDNLLNTQGSPIHLAKSITNLISNAAEAMPEGGKIIVTTDNMCISQAVQAEDHFQVRGYIVLTVSDTGVGISNEDIKRIFEPFYTKKKMGRSGTGLGMAVIWGTVKDHDGFIDIKSQEGKGTRITLFFPAFQEPISPSAQTPDLEKFQGNNETILVIDDDDVQREIAQNVLIKLGYTVFTVDSGREAVKFLQKNSVDLLVLDMIMDPEMDGLDTFRAITVMNPKQKIVIASGFSETDRVKELLAISGGQYIKKPYSISKIGRALKNSLSERPSPSKI